MNSSRIMNNKVAPATDPDIMGMCDSLLELPSVEVPV